VNRICVRFTVLISDLQEIKQKYKKRLLLLNLIINYYVNAKSKFKNQFVKGKFFNTNLCVHE